LNLTIPGVSVGRCDVSPTGNFTAPVVVIFTSPLDAAKLISVVLEIVTSSIVRLSMIMLPVPLARNSKSALDAVVVI